MINLRLKNGIPIHPRFSIGGIIDDDTDELDLVYGVSNNLSMKASIKN
jgi:hypothetical protein